MINNNKSEASNKACPHQPPKNLGFKYHHRVWTTQKLIDELENYIVRIKGEQQQQQQRKYLQRAIKDITYWTQINDSGKPHVFVFDTIDFAKDEMISTELYNLSRSNPSTLEYVLHEVVARLFAMISSKWFYESAAEEIKVILKP
jgi:hypothetical protein